MALTESRSIRLLCFPPYDYSHKRVQYLGRGVQACGCEHRLECGNVCGRITTWTIPHELKKIVMFLRIVAKHQIAKDEHSPWREEVREPLNSASLGLVRKVMEGVVREDFVYSGCADGVRKVLCRSNIELEVGVSTGFGCGPPDHIFCRIDSVSQPYERGKFDELSAWATADIEYGVTGPRVEKFQDLLHALSTTGVAICRIAFRTQIESFCVLFCFHLKHNALLQGRRDRATARLWCPLEAVVTRLSQNFSEAKSLYHVQIKQGSMLLHIH